MDLNLLWNGMKAFAVRAGRDAARTPLLLYYVLKSGTTSTRDKALIYAALAYLVLPIDLIPARRFHLLGWTDELLSMQVIFDRMRKYVTPAMYAQADNQLNNWFS